MVYIPTFTIKINQHVGKYTNDMDPMGDGSESFMATFHHHKHHHSKTTTTWHTETWMKLKNPEVFWNLFCHI